MKKVARITSTKFYSSPSAMITAHDTKELRQMHYQGMSHTMEGHVSIRKQRFYTHIGCFISDCAYQVQIDIGRFFEPKLMKKAVKPRAK